MGTLSVLLANEPKVYRDAIAAALRVLRPQLDVIVIDPDCVDASVHQHTPQVVICNQLTSVIETRVPAWMVLYPNGGTGAVLRLGGEQTVVEGMDLKGITRLIDHAGALAAPPGPRSHPH